MLGRILTIIAIVLIIASFCSGLVQGIIAIAALLTLAALWGALAGNI